MAHVRCLLQILLEFSQRCVDSSNRDLDDVCASAGVRSHVTLKGPRGSGRGLLCGVSGGRLSDVKKLITLLVSPSVALFKSISPLALSYISLIALVQDPRYPLPQSSI